MCQTKLCNAKEIIIIVVIVGEDEASKVNEIQNTQHIHVYIAWKHFVVWLPIVYKRRK